MNTYTADDIVNRYGRVQKVLLPYVSKHKIYRDLVELIPFKYVTSQGEVIEVKTPKDLVKVINDIINHMWTQGNGYEI